MRCATCPDREVTVTAWFDHIWQLYTLQRAGYPFAANDLTIDEWTDIGTLRFELEIPN